MNESNVRRKLADEWGRWAHVCPIENEVGTGIPDLNIGYLGLDFWVEIKYREELPKKIGTPVIRGMLRPQQRVWITHRLKTGAKNIFLFVRVGPELFLNPIYSKEYLDELEGISSQQLYNDAIWYWTIRQKPDWKGALDNMKDYCNNIIAVLSREKLVQA